MRPISRQKIGRDVDSSALRLIRRENGPNRSAIPVRLTTLAATLASGNSPA